MLNQCTDWSIDLKKQFMDNVKRRQSETAFPDTYTAILLRKLTDDMTLRPTERLHMVDYAFCWDATTQGHNYWKEVCYRERKDTCE